jgi:hypothetical protein
VRIRHRIPVTSPSRTIIDLAGLLRERDLARTVDEAEVRGLARRSELLAALERAGNGRRGSAVLAQILRRDKPAMTRSEAEHRLISLMARAGLPRPEVNVRIGGYEVDLLWRRARLVVEVDGYVFHRAERVARDRLRPCRYSCQAPPRRTGTSSPPLVTPVTATSSPPIMKSTWIEEWFRRPWSSSPAVKR